MNDKIVTVKFPKCGTCVYAQKFDLTSMADCFGHPPHVILLGHTKDAIGRPALQMEAFVPRVHKDRAACALHKPKDDFTTAGNS